MRLRAQQTAQSPPVASAADADEARHARQHRTAYGNGTGLESPTGLAGLRRLGRVTPEMLRASVAVGQLRRRRAAEAAAAASGRPETDLRALRAQHDLELHELLGLSADDPGRVAQVAGKCRHLAAPAGR